MNLTKKQVLEILAESRPDLTEAQWREEADVISVLSWLLPQEWNLAQKRLEELQ